jgi:hypothetical protein
MCRNALSEETAAIVTDNMLRDIKTKIAEIVKVEMDLGSSEYGATESVS